jgi:hypothetical protein
MFCTFTSALPAVCSAQYGCFLYSLDFVLSQSVAQVLSEWFWDGSICPYYCRYHLCFYIPHAINLYCKVFTLYNILSFFLDHISVSWNGNICWHPCSFFFVTDYDVWLTVRDGSIMRLTCLVCTDSLLLLLLLLLLDIYVGTKNEDKILLIAVPAFVNIQGVRKRLYPFLFFFFVWYLKYWLTLLLLNMGS